MFAAGAAGFHHGTDLFTGVLGIKIVKKIPSVEKKDAHRNLSYYDEFLCASKDMRRQPKIAKISFYSNEINSFGVTIYRVCR